MKKISSQAPLPLRFRHLILQFGRKNKTYVPKNKNKIKTKIKVIPHQCNITLKLKIFRLQAPLGSAKQRYFFCVLCGRGGLPSSRGDGCFLCIFYLCYYLCYLCYG